MTELPAWAIYVVAFGTPLSALVGVLISQWLTRRTAKGADTRSKREELMRNLRWAAELAASEDDRRSELGVAQLTALGESDLLDSGDQVFVTAALSSVIREPKEELDEIEAAGGDVEVVAEHEDHAGAADEVTAVVSWDPETRDKEVASDG